MEHKYHFTRNQRYCVIIIKYTAVSRPVKYNDIMYFCIDYPLCRMHRNIEVSFGRKRGYWIL